MKLPLSWLKDYVDIDMTPQDLASLLTFSGTQVEAIHTIGGDYMNVVVAEVRAIDRHPNADRLTVCRVFNGTGELSVVCGASNFKVGDKVPLAGIGAVLPNGTKVRKAKVRGVESAGMLCAEDELGLSDDHSGLLILPPATPAGTPFAQIAGPPETVFELEVTPNRPDCLSVIGIARELAALQGKLLRLPGVALAESAEAVAGQASVTIDDPDGCPRYTARLLSGIAIGPSPDWMQRRLNLSGVRPINNVVDITNYVMLECGQPLHAFDFELLDGRRIVVRRARAGETMSTLDGAAREITPDMLMIADAGRPVAVAGVMGGAGSEIREATRTVLLESAFFKPTGIRKTSKKLGLSTESSYRFERGVDVEGVEWASRRAAGLMAQHAGGVVAQGVIDVFPQPPSRPRVTVRFGRVRDLLGIELANAGIESVFTALGLRVTGRSDDSCEVEIPAFRVDLRHEVDLIEEVARIHGLDKIPAPSPTARIVADADDRPTRALLSCRCNLVGLGLTEIMNYSFLAERLLNLVGHGDPTRRIALPNPISADHTVLRDSLIPQMVETLGKNRARQAREAALFELGRVFFQDGSGKYREEDRLCVGLMGPVGRAGVLKAQPAQPDEMIYWIKGMFESLCRSLHVPEISQGGLSRPDVAFQPLSSGCFEDGQGVAVSVAGETCGVMGMVSERVRAEWRLVDPIAVLELNVAPLLGHALRVPSARPVAVYPGVERDVAMVVDDGVTHEAVLKTVWKAAPAELAGVRLFDIYRGKGLGTGKKSLAYSLTYRSHERTLTDAEANAMHDRIKGALRQDLQAEIRES